MKHDAALQTLILQHAFGPTLVVGGRPAVAKAAAASSAMLYLHATPTELARAEADAAAAGLVDVMPLPLDDEGRPELPEGFYFSSLIVLETPEVDDPADLIDQLLARCAHEAFLLFDLPAGGILERRLRLMLDGLARDVVTPPWAPEGRFLLRATREAPGRDAPEFESPEPLDVSVLVPTRGRPELLNELLVDLLFRQNWPPALVLIIDDAGPGEPAVPEDLWGMASVCETQPAILRSGGVGKATALSMALESVETSFVAVIDDDDRVAPNHLLALVSAMEENEGWVAVASDAHLIDGEGEPLGPRPMPELAPEAFLPALLEASVILQPTALMRRAAIEKAGGWNSRLERAQDWDLWIRLAEQGPIGRVPAPLALVRRHPGNAASRESQRALAMAAAEIIAEARERIPLETLAAGFVDRPPRARKLAALEARCRAALRIGDLEGARTEAESARVAAPDALSPRLLLAQVLRRARDYPALRKAADEAVARFPRAASARPLQALALVLDGAREEGPGDLRSSCVDGARRSRRPVQPHPAARIGHR